MPDRITEILEYAKLQTEENLNTLPEIGIFWVLDNDEIKFDSISCLDPMAIEYKATKLHYRTHMEQWDIMRRNNAYFAVGHKSDDFLQGRVVYDILDKKFIILTDMDRFSEYNKITIMEKFKLRDVVVEVHHSELYEEIK
jgi:hypothetical protein